MRIPFLSSDASPPSRRALSWPALGLLLGIFLLEGSQSAFALDDEDSMGECSSADSIQRTIDSLNAKKGDMSLSQRTRERAESDLSTYELKLQSAKDKCERRDHSRQREQQRCEQKIAKDGAGLWQWDAKKNECVDLQAKNQKQNPNSGECSNAELMKGNLQGQKCKDAADTIKDVTARNEALGQTALAATQAYSTMQSMQATGQQADALNRQQKIMQGLAAMKIATGVMALSGAASLKGAASGAEDASKNISGAHKDLSDFCYQDAMVAKMTPEQCFYKFAPERGVPTDSKSYATFERMKSAADQSQQQADRANALAKTSMVSGLADTMVGLQALYMSRQTGQQATAMGQQPVAPTVVGLAPMGASSGASAGLGAGGPAGPVGGPSGGEGVTLGEAGGGQIKGGLVGGRPAVFNTYKPEKSGVSGGGGGLSTSGGSRGGGKAASRGKGGMKSNTGSGDYTNTGVGGGSRVGGGGGGNEAGAGNPLGDMMCKLFPCNEAGKPIVSNRDVASENPAGAENPDDEQAAGVTPTELSIFEQISTRYRTLNGEGRI